MEPKRWRAIERLYQLALEQAPDQRYAFLQQACGGDKELRREVESLLIYGEGAEEYVKAAAVGLRVQTWDAPNVLAAALEHAVLEKPGKLRER